MDSVGPLALTAGSPRFSSRWIILTLIRHTLRRLIKLYGDIQAAEFGPRALKEVRDEFVREGLTRTTINNNVGRIKRMFRWGVENELLASVRGAISGTKTRIIHIHDWHIVPKDHIAIDTELKGKELDEAYAEHLQDVERAQKSQLKILTGVKEVFGEGLTDENNQIFKAEIRTLRPYHRELASFDPTAGEDTKQIFEEHRLTLLRLGAAGQLMLDEKLAVLPCGEVYENRPIKDGKLVLDQKVIEARDDAIVRNLIKRGGTCLLVLGGAHDLSDNIWRLTKGCGYVVATPKGWPE